MLGVRVCGLDDTATRSRKKTAQKIFEVSNSQFERGLRSFKNTI